MVLWITIMQGFIPIRHGIHTRIGGSVFKSGERLTIEIDCTIGCRRIKDGAFIQYSEVTVVD